MVAKNVSFVGWTNRLLTKLQSFGWEMKVFLPICQVHFYFFFVYLTFFALGVVVSDLAGRKTMLDDDDPLLDPLCFPLLHPKGTSGWRPKMPFRSFEEKEDQVFVSFLFLFFIC